MLKRNLAILGTALLVTSPLCCFGLRPTLLVEVLVEPTSGSQGQAVTRRVVTQPDSNGVVFWELRVQLPKPAQDVQLELRPETERRFYRQSPGVPLSDGVLAFVVQLGSPEWPVRDDQRYSFRFMSSDGESLLDGEVLARVRPIAGSTPWVVASIGLLASVLQILASVAVSATGGRPTTTSDRTVDELSHV
jgi:hypothetical protein